ncbi:transmembrane 7 superfamily member 3 isoform X2 [Xylocopa sonorina]|uniref:transmembrane 7 superfamily member 3 isoform X2 n=1 Tax=Xylocopa sonorina TaxID=1818115 RepID=UPI00403A84E3
MSRTFRRGLPIILLLVAGGLSGNEYSDTELVSVSNRSVFGSNIGLYSRLTKNIVTQLFVKNDNVHAVQALLVAIAYHNRAPIPGGCNMEFNTEIAPYANVQTLPAMVIVDVQPASMPLNNSDKPICQRNPVEHTMYQIFLPGYDFSSDTYFTAIRKMLTAKDIMENGYEVTNPTISSPMRRVFSAYTGTGSVYVAVATYGIYSSAYVPAFSYGCYPIVDPESCDVLPNFSSKFFCAVCMTLGFILIFLGHMCCNCDVIMPLLFTGTVIGYIIQGSIGIGLLIGIGISALITVAVCYHVPFSQILYSVMTLGMFFTSVGYYNSPDSFIILHSDWIFWILFTVSAISIGFIIGILSIITTAMTVAIFSSFLVILSIDYYVGSSLKYIIINIVRRATVEGFDVAIIRHPVSAADINLIILWSCLALYRFIRQWVSGRSSVETVPLLS